MSRSALVESNKLLSITAFSGRIKCTVFFWYCFHGIDFVISQEADLVDSTHEPISNQGHKLKVFRCQFVTNALC